MASNTDSVLTDTGIVEQDISPPRRPPTTRLPSRGRHALPWAALAAAAITTAVLTVSVFTGDDDASQPANRAALQHEAERYVEGLESRAASVPGANRAALEHQAEQYVEWLQSRAASTAEDGVLTDSFEPRSRHLPTR